MRARKPPRYQGSISKWKDEQGYGFIAPNGGGPAVFVHAKSFARRGAQPAEHDIVTYELTLNDKGQPRAANVAFVRDGPPTGAPVPARRPAWPAALAFLGGLALLAMTGVAPRLVFFHYLGISIVTFVVYAADKAAARAARRRTPENTLHCLGLLGGWPGAMLAQQLLRHKSSKQSFQVGLRWTVALNCAALLWCLTPSGQNTLRTLLKLP